MRRFRYSTSNEKVTNSANIKETEPINPERNIIICLDGTGGEFGEKPHTNVLDLFKLLEKDSPNQYCYYQPGIGVKFVTDAHEFLDSGFFESKYHKMLNRADAMVAFTLRKHIIAAYTYLCDNYRLGDKVYLFGFRGSFAARVLAGMIERVGLLNKGLIYMTPTAWEMYSNWEYAGQPLVNDPKITLIEDFTKSFTRNKFDFEFMGLWDSVNSVGLVVDKLFPFTTTTYNVKHVRHALSIDERRAKFKQLMIQSYSDLENVSVENSDASSLGLIVTAASNLLRKVFQPGLKNTKPSLRHSDDIVEMFFPGDHSDCGGGWIIDDEGVCLSDISLRWMLLEAIVAGVKFKTGAINKFDSQNPVLPSLLSHHHDLLSVEPPKSFVNDKVAGVPTEPLDRYEGRGEQSIFASLGWWAVELLPIQMKYEDENGEWKRGFEPNLGRNRLIPKECRLHWSFFYRVHYIADYKPNHTIAEERYGHYMLELLATHKGLFKGKDLEKYCSKLNLDVIRNDYDNEIWKIIPNDLQVCLELNPSL